MDEIDIYTPQASVLGAILLDPRLMGEAMTQIRADDFVAANCRVAWQAMTGMFREGLEIDPVLLRDRLAGFDGATALITSCMELAPLASNFPAHVQALKRQSMLQRLKELGTSLADAAGLEEALALLDKGNAISITRSARERRNMSGMLRSFGTRHSSSVVPEYLPWPFKPLNDGIKVAGGKYIVIGGYPSDGKTAFSLACATCQAKAGKKTIFYSFETDANTVEDRLMASLAEVSLQRIQDNQIQDDEWTRYAQASSAAEWPFEVVNAAGMTVDDIRADALANRAAVVYIDYLQLISLGRANKSWSRYEEVSEISRQLQQFAKTTGTTVVALSQMARPQADKKGNVPEPTMHNLRESGQIEQDADVIMLLYRVDQKNIRAPRRIKVDKNKEGRTGRWWLDFDGQYQRFELSDQQTKPEGMPKPKGTHRTTPVLGDNQQSFSLLNGEDKDLPFDK